MFKQHGYVQYWRHYHGQFIQTSYKRLRLKKPTAYQLIKKFPHFVKLDGPLRCSKQRSTCPYPTPDNPVHALSTHLKLMFILSSYLRLGIPSGLSLRFHHQNPVYVVRLKRHGTRAETRFSLSPKRTSPFKSAEASVQSTAGSRGVRISVSNAGYTTFRGSESTGYPLHSPVSPSLPLPCVTVCHQVSNALYHSSPPYVQHTQPISFFFIWLPE